MVASGWTHHFDGLINHLQLDGDEAALPWTLTVHFNRWPQVLLKAAGDAAEKFLLNALKESCYLGCGSSLPVMCVLACVLACMRPCVSEYMRGTFAGGRVRASMCIRIRACTRVHAICRYRSRCPCTCTRVYMRTSATASPRIRLSFFIPLIAVEYT